jgi:hypothetical protein
LARKSRSGIIQAMTKDQVYNYHFQLFIHESKIPWEISQLFLTSNTIFLAITGAVLVNKYFFPALIFSLGGLIITLSWFFSYNRTVKVMRFRMAQVKAIEPRDSNLLAGTPELLAEGGCKEIGGKCYDFKVMGNNAKTTQIFNRVIIFTFLLLYIFILSFSLSIIL